MNYRTLMYCIFASLLGLALMYLDTKLLDNPKSRATYIKGMVMSGLVTWAVLYFLEGGFGSSSGSYLHEEILTGPPDF